MKNFLFLLFLLPICAFAQVGVNTTTPNAMLDVQSTSNGVLIPRVQLTSITDNATITNPAGGALTTSTLVYNMAAAGVSPNNVVAGFYYWDNSASRWIPIGGNTTSDHDWYEEGTTTPPDAITDKMFHTGNVAIGKNTTNSPLEVETNAEFETGIKNNFTSNVNLGVERKGFNNELLINSNDQSVGINTVLSGTGSGFQYGISNEILNSNNGNHIGAYNYLIGNGNGYHSGTENYLLGSGNGIHTGTKNEIVNSGNNVNHGTLNEIHGAGTGEHYGTFNGLSGSGSGPQVGTANSINNSEDNTHTGTSNTITSSGDGANYGVFNNLNGTGHGYQYGSLSLIQNTGAGYHFGNYLNMIGTGSGNRYGNYTTINNNNLGDNFGSYSVLTGDGNGYHYGSFISLGGNGNGEHTANYNIVSGTGTGTKYGTKNIVPVFAGGRHFGVYSEVLKPGSNNFAGYFLGNVGIGTTTLNTYTLPPSRGTNGQIMRTDGFGNVTWQNLTSHAWDLNGNTAIISPATPATYGTSTIGATENFLGTTDNNDVTIGTNNIERMRIKNTTGNVGIGIANPSSTLEIVSGGTTELKLSSRAFFGPTRFSMISDKELPDEWRPTFIESADNGSFTGRMDFFTNGTGIANKFGSLRAMSITNGKVGVGTINPAEKIHVFDSSDANKSSIYSEARQISTGTDYDNIAIKGYGRAMPSWGFGNGVMGIGDTANSYHATGVYAHLGSTAPVLPSTNQALYANGNNLGNAGIFMGGNVGINTQTPTLAKLQVDGMVGSTTALFRGNSTTSQGLSMIADWPGIYFNSYYNGAIRQMSNSGFPTIINTDQSSGGLVFQTSNVANTTSGGIIASIPVRMTITGTGNVGVGTSNPEQLLSSNLGIKVDQSNSNVGTSANALSFGSGTGESIGSKRSATGNQYGLDFYTANANRMRIFNPGEVVIGQQNGGNLLPGTLGGINSSLTVWNSSTASQSSDVPVFVARHSGTSGTTWQMGSIEYYTEGEANIGFTYQICPLNDNTFTNLGSSASSKYFGYRWNQLFCTVGPNVSSDITLKKDIQNLAYGIHQLRSINPITYKFKVDNAGTDKDVPDSEKRTHIGFSAQELKQIVPEIVSSWGYISNNEKGYIKAKTPTLGVIYEEMIPVTVNAIKQLDQQQQEIIKTITISDFGTIESSNDETWVSYNSDFKQKLKGTPIVTITATIPNANYYIKNQNQDGFTVKNNNANQSLTFNWMAMGKIDENNMEIKTDYTSEIHQQKLNEISSFENSLPTNKEALMTIKSQSK